MTPKGDLWLAVRVVGQPLRMRIPPFITPGTLAVVALVLTLWAGAFLVPIPTQREPLRVAVPMWAGAESLIMARNANELNSEEVNLVEMNWTSAAMRAVGNKVVDAAVLSLDEVIRQIGQGYPLKVIMVLDISKGADLLVAKPEIKSVADLKGARIGYEPRTSGSWLLGQALENSKLKLGDVAQVPLNPAEVEEIFHELSLDAVVLAEPWRQRLTSMNLKTLYDSSRPGAAIVRVLAVHPEAVKDHRDTLLDLLRAQLKWSRRLADGRVDMTAILRREGVSKEVFQNIRNQLEVVDIDRNLKLLRRDDPWLAELFTRLQNSLSEQDESAGRLNVEEVFDASLLEELK